MAGGSGSTAEKYAKFGAGEYSSSDFESYVDSRPDLAAAWSKIESDPTAWDSKYWIDKGATSKSAFGRAHAAEDAELYAGTYGAGGTKVVPGSPEYEAYFGDSGGTSFDSFISGASGEGEGGGGGSSGIGPGNPYYPQRVQAFTPRTAQDYSAIMPAGSPLAVNKGILYQADINSQGIPDSIWNYQPPMLYASGGGGGGLSMGTGGGGHFIPTGMLSVESHSPSSSSSSVPVGSAGYPQGDPRNPEDRGGPDRPDGGGGADSDTQTRHDTSVPATSAAPHFSTISFPSDVAIAQGFVSTPTLAQDIAANKARQEALAAIAKAEKQVAIAGSDYQQEQARAMMARANAQAAETLGLFPSDITIGQGFASQNTLTQDIAANKARQDMIGLIAAAEKAAQAKSGSSGSSSGGSFGGDPGHAGPGGDFGGPGHSRR